ncbi:MAG TPA: MFS transporter [Gemmatimonadaceae bacterium]
MPRYLLHRTRAVTSRTLNAPPWLTRDIRLLLSGRALRSLSQGFLTVIVPVYLARLGYSATRVGVVFTAGAAGSIALTASVGLFADRIGRKPLLIALGLLTSAAALTFAVTTQFAILLIAAACGTIGRGGGAGSSGAYGPYYPAEQPLITEKVPDRTRTHVFGVVAVVGVLSGAVGSLAAALPTELYRWFALPEIQGDRAMFFAAAVIGCAMALVILPVNEPPPSPRKPGRRLQPATTRVLWRFLITNATNGLAVGMLGPVLVYWFHVRFGATVAQLGTLYFLANLLAAPSNLMAGYVAKRLGTVRAVVTLRAIAVILMAAMALVPTFLMAALLFLVRTQVNTMANPMRQSFLMGIVDPADRSAAAGLSNLPLQILSSAGPTIAGQLMQFVWVSLPLELAAGLQAVNTVLYHAFFHKMRLPEERDYVTRDPAAPRQPSSE